MLDPKHNCDRCYFRDNIILVMYSLPASHNWATTLDEIEPSGRIDGHKLTNYFYMD